MVKTFSNWIRAILSRSLIYMYKGQTCGRLAPILLTAMLRKTTLLLTNTSTSTMTTSTTWWYIMETFPKAPLAPALPIHLKTHLLSWHVMTHRSKLLLSPECSTRPSSMLLPPVSLRYLKMRLPLLKDPPSLSMVCKTETLARWNCRKMKLSYSGRWTAIWRRARRQYLISKLHSLRLSTRRAASWSERTALSRFTSLLRGKVRPPVLLSLYLPS